MPEIGQTFSHQEIVEELSGGAYRPWGSTIVCSE